MSAVTAYSVNTNNTNNNIHVLSEENTNAEHTKASKGLLADFQPLENIWHVKNKIRTF